MAGISDTAAERLLAYAWPGNVRELRNVIERAVALTHYDKIAVEDLPEKIRDYRSSQVFIGGEDPTELVPLEEVERRYILHVLHAAGGNKTTGRPDPGPGPQDALPQAQAIRDRGNPIALPSRNPNVGRIIHQVAISLCHGCVSRAHFAARLQLQHG